MLRSLLLDPSITVEHRHSDGSWGEMEAQKPHHDSSQHDQERGWQYGVVYRCDACEEEIRISSAESKPPQEGA